MKKRKPVTQETREKLRQASMGHIVSKEAREKNRQAHLGKKASEETRKRMSEMRKGKKMPPFTKEHCKNISLAKMGNIPWNKGKKGVQVSTRKGKRNLVLMGENNPAWKGGVTAINIAIRGMPEYKEWQQKVFRRDNFICQRCKYSKGHILEADHIIPLSWLVYRNRITNIQEAFQCKEIWDINNGKTLCIPCHKLTPTWGKKYKTWIKENNLC